MEAGPKGSGRSVEKKNTWTETVLPPRKDYRPCRVVIKRTLDEQRRIARYKGLVIAKLRIHKYNVDLEETLAPLMSVDVLLLIVRKFM